MIRWLVLVFIFLGSFSSGFSQIIERKRMFGSVNVGTGPPYGLIGANTEIGFSRYGINLGTGMAKYYPFIIVGGMNYYFYPARRIHQIRGRCGVHFGTIEHDNENKALWPFFALGMEYWFRNYFTFNLDFNMPFKDGFYAARPSLGVGYNFTAAIQNSKSKKSEKEDDKVGKRKAPKATF